MPSGVTGQHRFRDSLYDGLFQHKVLGLHQIRYHVDVLPYDLVWNIGGGIGILIGAYLLFGHAGSVAEHDEPAASPTVA